MQKLLKHTSAANLLPKAVDAKRLSTANNTSNRSTHGTPANNVPQSPIKVEFISEPHMSAIEPIPRRHDLALIAQAKSQAKISANRELNFIDPLSPDICLRHPLEDQPPSPLLPQFRDHPLVPKGEANPVSIHSIPQVIQEFGNQDPGKA